MQFHIPQKLRTLISQTPEWQHAQERERFAQQFCDGDPKLAVFAHALRRKAVSALAKARSTGRDLAAARRTEGN